jgi:hypothetical protein
MALTAAELEAIRKQSAPMSGVVPPSPTAEGAAPTQSVEDLGVPFYPTAGEKAEAIAVGAGQGAAKGTSVMAGARMGAEAGLRLAASPLVPGPGKIALPVLGTVGGAGLGLLGAEALDALMFDEYNARMRPEVAPYREGGTTFGQSIAAAPWMFSLPVMTGNRVSRFISQIGETARKTPATFLAGETLAGGAAGIAGGTVYAIDPEAKGTRLAAEVTAGVFTPTRLFFNGYNMARDMLTSARAGADIKAQNTAAAQLQKILEEQGEDIPKLIRQLEKPLPGSVSTPTSAQKTGSLVLTEVERTLGNMNLKFAADTEAQGKEALRAYGLLMERLKEVGTPEALTRVAEMRDQLFTQALDARLAKADADAARKIVKIKQDNPAARAQIGEIVKTETTLALQNARDAEKMLWDEAIRQATKPTEKTVRMKVERPPSNQAERLAWERTGRLPIAAWDETRIEPPKLIPSATFDTFLKRASEVGTAAYNQVIPKVVQDIMQELGATRANVLAYKSAKNTPEYIETGVVRLPARYTAKEVDVSELINYRSNLLALARDSAGRGDVSDANLYSTLADALLTDLNTLKNPAFDAARDFSRALNDTFTRTFGKTATIQGDVARTGAERLPAEILVTRAFGQNADVTAMRMNEIEDAVRFARTQYDQAVQRFGPKSDQAQMLKPLADLSDQSVVSIQDAQSRVMRLLAARTVDPVTGRVNPRQLQAFVNENQAMLDKLGLTNDMTDIVKAELALKQVAADNSHWNKTLRSQEAFAQVLKAGENPTNAVVDVLNSRSPVLGMRKLMEFAQSGGQTAVDGLKATLMDYAFTKAGGIDNFNPEAFRRILVEPLAPNKPSLVNMMRTNGMISREEMRSIGQLTKAMMQVEDAMANRQTLDSVIQGSGIVTDLALRVIGSKVGSTAAGGSGPGTLIAASAGSKAMRSIFDKMPAGMTRAAMEQAMRDPTLLALMLKQPANNAQSLGLARDITSRMVSSGVLPASMLNYLDAAINQPPVERQRPTQPPRQSAPPTRGVPPITPVAAPASAPAPAGGGQKTSAASGDMYQALFPQDPISSLMAMQPRSG